MKDFNAGYYATVAQVLPLLVVIVAFERRIYHEQGFKNLGGGIYVLAVISLMAWAEVLSLVALANQTAPGGAGQTAIVIGLAVGGISTIAPVVRGAATHFPRWLANVLYLLVVAGLCLAISGVLSPEAITPAFVVLCIVAMVGSLFLGEEEAE